MLARPWTPTGGSWRGSAYIMAFRFFRRKPFRTRINHPQAQRNFLFRLWFALLAFWFLDVRLLAFTTESAMTDLGSDALEDAKALAAKLRAIHEAQPSYKAWQAAEGLVQQLSGSPSGLGDALGDLMLSGGSTTEVRIRQRSRLTQTDAAALVLNEKAIPLPTPALLQLIEQKGSKVGGADPLVNLSSALSKDDRFDSVRWGGERRWWFRGKPMPHDDLGELLGDPPAVIQADAEH